MSFGACTSEKNALKIMGNDDKSFAVVKSERNLKKSEYETYLLVVADEAVEIIAEKYQLDQEEAKKKLYSGGYTVYTAFDKTVNDNLKSACEEKCQMLDTAVSITDLESNIIAIYSSGKSEEGEDFALKSNRPCSSFKPLSVYAPALDNGTINWSSRYEDSPYKYVKNLEGIMSPWPNNATKIYSERYAYIFQAVKESLNTVAVKCLSDYGIENSINFLEENFGVLLNPEVTTAKVKGYEEVIGNIALGFLSSGVSTVDMAGYYQIFANGGKYDTPRAIVKICDSEGSIIYKREYSPKQVVKQSTAEIMNRMLKEVVSTGGTGEKAYSQKVEVAGKTGTDDNGENNWFVGVTPEYSIAFWHGYDDKNRAAEFFSNAIDKIYNAKDQYKKRFTYRAVDVKEVVYCTESAKQFKSGCSFVRTGYYTQDKMPGVCDRH